MIVPFSRSLRVLVIAGIVVTIAVVVAMQGPGARFAADGRAGAPPATVSASFDQRPVVQQAPVPERTVVVDRRLIRAFDVIAIVLLAVVSVGMGVARRVRRLDPGASMAAAAIGGRVWSRRGPPARA